MDLLSSYSPPALDAGTWSTTYGYDLDRRLTNVTRPDGSTAAWSYDVLGRLSTLTTPQGTQTYSYSSDTGQVTSVSTAGGETTTYSYDGFLRTGVAWSGPVAGTITLGFDNNFRVTSQAVAGTPVTLVYDADGLLSQAGALVITRDPQNGRVTATSIGSLTDSYTYDGNGMLASYVAKNGSNVLYAESISQRDANGRITQRNETTGSTSHAWVYTYDANGRVTDVIEDGGLAAHYGYDADDNRNYYTGPDGTIVPTYDAQDRLLTLGDVTYGYNRNGELQTKTGSSGTSTYSYDMRGNLLAVILENGSTINYVPDAENRRVGMFVNGAFARGLLYLDHQRPIAQLDSSGNIVARFVYGTKANVPDYFSGPAGTYRILTDHLGSPKLVVNAATGDVAEQIDYDAFGRVTNDTQPGLTPFGFAGGLYDPNTGLVRFGARDYDPASGRWTAKDPLRFQGGQANLYNYVWNDPINRRDPSGLEGGVVIVGPITFGGADATGWGAAAAGLGPVAAGVGAAGTLAAGGYVWWQEANAPNPPWDESDCEGGTACYQAPQPPALCLDDTPPNNPPNEEGEGEDEANNLRACLEICGQFLKKHNNLNAYAKCVSDCNNRYPNVIDPF